MILQYIVDYKNKIVSTTAFIRTSGRNKKIRLPTVTKKALSNTCIQARTQYLILD